MIPFGWMILLRIARAGRRRHHQFHLRPRRHVLNGPAGLRRGERVRG
jgi:hypothetical protein